MGDAPSAPGLSQADFQSADAHDRARLKCARQRILKRRLDDAGDELRRIALEIHGSAALAGLHDEIFERIRIGEDIAAFAHKLSGEICDLEPYGARPERRTLSQHLVTALFDWPLDAAMRDGVASAAAELELERIA